MKKIKIKIQLPSIQDTATYLQFVLVNMVTFVLYFKVDNSSCMSQPDFGLSVRMKLTFPKVGSWSPPRLLKTQSLIAGVKTPRIEVFFISMKRS
jgi:hypothetical protein